MKLRGWAQNLALFAASSLVTALAIEGAARLWAPIPAPVELRDGLFVSSLALINGHPSCRWIPSVKGAPLPLVKRPGELRVFVFGESSVQGSPWDYPGSPATMLRDQLAVLLPGRPVTVVNMGRSCSSTMDSYYYLLSVAPYRPDIVVFYQGSNDRYDVDRERCLVVTAPPIHAAWRFLTKHSRALWAARAMAPQAVRRWENRMITGPVPPGKPRCDPNEAFSRWTRILVGAAKDLGAQVIVTSPVRNPVLPVEMNAWTPKPSSTADLIRNLDAGYRKILRCELAPACDPARFIPAGLPELEIEGRGQAWKATAAADGARFVDFRSLLRSSAPRGESTGQFFVGETHLTLEGYWLLSSLWAGAVVDLVSGGEPRPASPAKPQVQRYLDDLQARGNPVETTFYQEGLSYLRARMLLLAVPCLAQAAKRRSTDALLVLARIRQDAGLPPQIPESLKPLWARFDLEAHLKSAPARSAETPTKMSPDMRAALDSFAKGDLQNTEAAVARVLEKDPANATGLLMRGSVFLHTKRFSEALQDFDRILQSAPSRPEVLADALSNRGQTLEQLGRKPEAAKDYARCLAVAPRAWTQRAAVESLLRAAQGAAPSALNE